MCSAWRLRPAPASEFIRRLLWLYSPSVCPSPIPLASLRLLACDCCVPLPVYEVLSVSDLIATRCTFIASQGNVRSHRVSCFSTFPAQLGTGWAQLSKGKFPITAFIRVSLYVFGKKCVPKYLNQFGLRAQPQPIKCSGTANLTL